MHCLGIDVAVHLGSAAMPGMIAVWPLPQTVIDRLETSARERLAAALGTMDIVSEAIVLRGSPVDGILEAAGSAAIALVVVGTRGRTGLTRVALGSVAENVISRASCSVLVVPLHPA